LKQLARLNIQKYWMNSIAHPKLHATLHDEMFYLIEMAK